MLCNTNVCPLSPAHPALAAYDPDCWPWQETGSWRRQEESVIIDTISVTFHVEALKISVESDLHFRATATQIVLLAGLGLELGSERGSKNFYQKSWDVVDANGHVSGFIATGGNRNTVQVYINGDGCAVIRNWQEFYSRCAKLGVRISRIDLAHDDFRGKHNIKTAVAMYKAGKFGSGGRMPKCSQAGNWIVEDGKGRTFYVGSRGAGKLIRIYEKGKQLGDTVSPWTRWELEMVRDKVDIPLESIISPTEYFVGAYPRAFDWIKGIRTHLEAVQRKAAIGFDALVRHARNQYGKLVNVMRDVGYSAERIVDELIRTDGVPGRLIMPVMGHPPVSNTGGK